MIVYGFDLSLTAPTVCRGPGDLETFTPKAPPNAKKATRGEVFDGQMDRLDDIADWVYRQVWHLRDNLVVIEDYSYGSVNRAHQIGELGGVVRHMLWKFDIPTMVVTPMQVKKYATGKGNASKDLVMIEAARRGVGMFDGTTNDHADAFWIWALGNWAMGQPVLDVPVTHTKAKGMDSLGPDAVWMPDE